MRRVTGDRPSHLILRYKNRRSWRIDVSLFVELEEELGLFRQNHFYVSFALATSFSSSGVSSLRSCRFCFAKSLYISFPMPTAEGACFLSISAIGVDSF